LRLALRAGVGTQDGGQRWQEYPLPDGTADAYAVACA
jgi:hypothetical protein